MSEPPDPGPGTRASASRTRLPSLGSRGEGWFLLQLVLMGLIGVSGLVFGANWSGAPRFAAALAGAVMIAFGVGLGFLGIRDLDSSLSPLPRPTDSSVLVSHGVYRRLRHPIYTGVMLLGLGWALLTASLPALALALVLCVVLDLKSRREEVWLSERFADYAAYAARTRRFIPGLY